MNILVKVTIQQIFIIMSLYYTRLLENNGIVPRFNFTAKYLISLDVDFLLLLINKSKKVQIVKFFS